MTIDYMLNEDLRHITLNCINSHKHSIQHLNFKVNWQIYIHTIIQDNYNKTISDPAPAKPGPGHAKFMNPAPAPAPAIFKI